jgi:hypothetical protein
VITRFAKINYLLILAISISAGVFTFSILSYALVASRIAIPLSIVISMLIFGLAKYYSVSIFDANKVQGEYLSDSNKENYKSAEHGTKESSNVLTAAFVTIFVIAILISSFAHTQEFRIFINWDNIGLSGIIQLGSAILLCFFLPGYAIVLVITKKYKVRPILKVLLAYLMSILITGLTAYIVAIFFDKAIVESRFLFIALYLGILASFLIFYPRYRTGHSVSLQVKKFFYNHALVDRVGDLFSSLKKHSSELLVFAGLLMLLVIVTYYLYDGITIGDQWYHQGRALLFMSGSFKEAALSAAEAVYTPFQSAMLAALTTLSGIPLVNSYASIALLNMTLIFAFYYFFLSWVPPNMRRAALLACTLFILSAGFGWIYFLNTSAVNSERSPDSTMDILSRMGPLDIISSSNFVISTAPQFSTGLTYMALPAGFVLLGVVRNRFPSTLVNFAVVTSIAILGMISNDEFYIFLIIASLLPIMFRMDARNYMYAGFIVASLFVYLVDISSPRPFFTLLKIFGIPLILLSLSFVVVTWAIKLSAGHLHKVLEPGLSFLNRLRQLPYHSDRFRFLAQVSIVSLVAYLYLLSFIVLGQLPIQTIIDQTRDNTVPWYLYPMRMGMVGLFGLAFIMSYLFRKFDKHVFVFGILVVISFITGPYYDEHRFSKYMMVGLAGFASLMIYNILNQRFNDKLLVNSVLLGLIITSSGLSTLLYVGYNSLIYQTQDFTETLARRNFPSMSELHMFEILHDKIDINSKKYNVISFVNEYDRLQDGVMAKITAFSGLPYDKIRQAPLTLNASTLDALYRHFTYSDARFILIPKHSIQDVGVVTEPTRFVLEYFKRVYEDDNYILLEIPIMVPPNSSSKAEVALVYNETDDLITKQFSDIHLLLFDNKTFNFTSDEKLVNVQKENLTQVLNLLGEKLDKGITVWSKNISEEKKVNYIESRFKIASENENKSNDVRIEWQEPGDRSYYVKLSNAGLELYQKSKDDLDKRILLKNAEIDKENGTWYNIKIERLDDLINIYLNNLLKIQVPSQDNSKTQGISKVGLTTYYNDVVFKPLEIGSVSDYGQEAHAGIKYYNYYYPLSLLALSKSNYDTFSNTDPSVFTKDVIIVPDSLLHDNARLKQYLDYVHAGGKLIIVNSQVEFSTILNQLFNLNITGGEEESFTNIGKDRDQNVMINVSGDVKMTNITSLSDIHTIASYRNNKNVSLAPFIIEKSFSGGGKIYLLNFGPYFNSISNSPTQYFLTLSNASKLLPVDLGQGTIFQDTSIPSKGFIGKMQISGKVTFNSSFLTSSMPHDYNEPYLINTSRISIFKSGTDVPIVLNNVSIKDLKVTGDHETMIDIMGTLELPDVRSNRDYFGIQIPTGSNMAVKLSPNGIGNMEIVTQNESSVKSISFSNDSRVEIYNVKAPPTWKLLPILLKEPKMSVDGSIRIKHAYLSEFINERGRLDLGPPVDFRGNLETKLELVDNFNQPYRNTTSSTSVTYLQTPVVDGTFSQDSDDPKLPGDIHFGAKQRGQEIPLEKIITSPSNIITVISLITVTVMVSKVIWRRKYS